MSFKVFGSVLQNSEETLGRRLVLLVLAEHAHDDGRFAFPAVDTIALKARLSRRQVQRCLRELEEHGAIERDGKGPNGQTCWTLILGDKLSPPEGATSTTSGATSTTSDVSEMSPEPSLTVQEPSQPRERGDVEVVWDHYVEVMQPRGRELDAGARALIRDALKVATAVECCAAIDGCRASPFHMGQNDRGKKYNRLSQILKGKRGVRTLREQIDLFLDVAERAGVGSVAPSVDQAKLAQAKRNVLTAWEMPGSEQARKAGEMSAAWLAQHGYTIVPGEGGRPQFHRDSE